MILYVLFSACYSSEVAGFMFLSERVIMRPLIIVSSSLLQVFTGEAGRSVSQDPWRLRARFYQVVTRQFLFAASWIYFISCQLPCIPSQHCCRCSNVNAPQGCGRSVVLSSLLLVCCYRGGQASPRWARSGSAPLSKPSAPFFCSV